jgi:hypothetical protein
MRSRWSTLVLGLAVVAGVGIAAWAQDSGAKRVRKPTRVSVVESIPLTLATPVEATVSSPIAVGELPPTTHVNRRLDDFVVLSLVNPTTSPIFVRSHDDGTQDAAEFVVPAGRRLVVTDVDWLVHGPFAFFMTLRVFVEKGANRCPVAYLTNRTANEPSDGAGSATQAFGTTGTRAGFVVGAGARVVVDLRDPRVAATSGTTLAPFTDGDTVVVLRGYLADD